MVRREPFERVKTMCGRMAGCMRWERESRTDSRNRMWVASESARMGEGLIEHRRVGWDESLLSESYGDWGRQSENR